MRRYTALLVALALLVTTACGAPSVSSASNAFDAPTVSASNAGPTITLITDEAVLRELWDVYLESTPQLLRERVEDLSTLTAARATTVAITVWSHSNDITSLPPVEIPSRVLGSDKTKQGYLWTLAEATAQVERVFDMKIADPEAYFAGMEYVNANGPYYLPEAKGIALLEKGPWVQDNAYGEPSGGYLIDSATDNGDGTVSVNLVHNDERVNKPSNMATFVLGKLPDGGYCYKTVHNEHYNNNVANLSGNYRAVDMAGTNAHTGTSMLWQDGDSVILSSEGGRARQNRKIQATQLMRINTKTAKVEKLVDIETPILDKEKNYLNVHGTASGIVVASRYGVRLYDLDTLALLSDTPLPDSLTAKMIPTVYAETADGVTVSKEFFEDFAIAADGSRYCYSNHEGLFAVDTATGKETMLRLPSAIHEGDAVTTARELQLVDGDSKVTYVTYLYEGVGEYGFVDLATGKGIALPDVWACLGSDGCSTVTLREDMSTVVTYADYATASQRTVTIAPHDLDPAFQALNPTPLAPSSRNYLATGVCLGDSASSGWDIFSAIYRVRLADMSLEKLDFNIEVDFSLLGVTDEGTIILCYSYSQGEAGMLLLD